MVSVRVDCDVIHKERGNWQNQSHETKLVPRQTSTDMVFFEIIRTLGRSSSCLDLVHKIISLS